MIYMEDGMNGQVWLKLYSRLIAILTGARPDQVTKEVHRVSWWRLAEDSERPPIIGLSAAVTLTYQTLPASR
jgi:hypothetical protein